MAKQIQGVLFDPRFWESYAGQKIRGDQITALIELVANARRIWRTVLTRMTNSLAFCRRSGKWQKSKHQAAGQSPLMEPQAPVPVSRLNLNGFGESPHAGFPSPILTNLADLGMATI